MSPRILPQNRVATLYARLTNEPAYIVPCNGLPLWVRFTNARPHILAHNGPPLCAHASPTLARGSDPASDLPDLRVGWRRCCRLLPSRAAVGRGTGTVLPRQRHPKRRAPRPLNETGSALSSSARSAKTAWAGTPNSGFRCARLQNCPPHSPTQTPRAFPVWPSGPHAPKMGRPSRA